MTQESKRLKVKLYHSPIACPPKHRAILKGLGLKKLNQEKELPDNCAIRGMIAKVSHLVKIVS